MHTWSLSCGEPIFQYPTLKSLFAKLNTSIKPKRTDSITVIRNSGNSLPLFMPHDGIGELFYTFIIAPHIDADIPVYGLPPTPTELPQLRTVEAMATRMVRILRSVQPDGPYRIAGYCFGGTLAYEVAVQLIGENQEVDFLAMLDPEPPEISESIPEEPRDQLIQLFTIFSRNFDPGDLKATLDELRSLSEVMDFESLLQKCRPLLPSHLCHLSSHEITRYLTRLYKTRRASLQYVPQSISMPVHLFVPEENKSIVDIAKAWIHSVPQNRYEIVSVQGGHNTMLLTPNVERLGKKLSEELRRTPHKGVVFSRGESSCLLPLRMGRVQDTLLCVPGAGATITSFTDLAAALELSWHVCGFEARGIDGTAVPHSSVEAAAESYLTVIRETDTSGTLHLLGHSFGGWIAFEMAQRLSILGRNVRSLIILDSEVPDGPSEGIREYDSIDVIAEWISTIELMLGFPFPLDIRKVKLLDEVGRLELLHGALVKSGLLPARSTPDLLRGSLRVFGAALRAHYCPRDIYSNPVCLILADDAKSDRNENERKHQETADGWRRWAPNLTVVRAPGNHLTLLKAPHVNLVLRHCYQVWARSSSRPTV